MFKVVIAEDEPLARRTLKKLLEHEHSDIEVVGEATTGEEALSMIYELKPDLLVTDIRMPVMDGIELVKNVFQKGIDIEVVVISGFQEFRYAQAALRYGVRDYILKPITAAQIKETITEVLEILHEKCDKNKCESLCKLLGGKTNELAQIEDTLECSKLLIGVLRKKGLPVMSQRTKVDSGSRIYYNQHEQYWLVQGRDENEVIMLTDSGIFDKIQCYAEEWIVNKEYYTIIAHNKKVNLADVYTRIGELLKYLDNKTVIGKSQCFDFRAEYIDEPTLRGIKEEVFEQYTCQIKSNQTEELKKNLIEQFLKWEKNEVPLYVVYREIKKILLILVKYTGDMSDTEECTVQETICYSNNMGEVLESIWYVISEKLRIEKGNCQKNCKDNFIQEVEIYLQKNIDQSLQVEVVCNYFGISQTYFSRLFKLNKQCSFKEYFTKMKIEKAISIMQSQDAILLKDVAKMVGYDDTAYFSRVFKNQVGKSPSEYLEIKK